MSDIQAWFNSLPQFTRLWFGLTVLFTLVGRFGLVSAYYLALLYEPLFKQLQVRCDVYLLIPCVSYFLLVLAVFTV